MILYFLRHGAAGHHSSASDDDARELTAEGVAELQAAAPLWRRLNLRPDLVLTSPLPRARRTADLFVAGMGLRESPVEDDRLRPGAGWGDLARAMAAHPDARRVMFVGHEPDLSSAVSLLTGAASVRMRKAGLACVEFPGVPEPRAGELAWLLDPDLYVDDERPGRVTRVAAYALCLDDAGRILLCRLSPGEVKPGQWTLPGGGVDFGEDLGAAVLRELDEETGLTGEIISLAGVESWVRAETTADGNGGGEFHAIQVIYRVRATGGDLRDETNGSTDAAAWFTRAELAELPIVGLVEAGLRLLEAR
ncbi:MAG: NUDIX domain-containing protein [Chloroflexota bacterium]